MSSVYKVTYITGTTGFLGRNFFSSTNCKNFNLTAISERFPFAKPPQISDKTCILHLAGLAHNKENDNCEFSSVNSDYPVCLARIAKLAGAKRFIYISSVNVYSLESIQPITELSATKPIGAYANSKFMAESELLKLADDNFEVIILRCPLIYGLEAPANFSKLKRLVDFSPILPFGTARELRSYLSIDNFCSAICTVLSTQEINSGVYNISDNHPLSTKELTTLIRKTNEQFVYQIPIPKFILRLLGKFLRVNGQLDLLFEKFVISNDKFYQATGWTPIETPERALYKIRGTQ